MPSYVLGDGAFDVFLLIIDKGDTQPGGEDFDQRMIQHFIKIQSEGCCGGACGDEAGHNGKVLLPRRASPRFTRTRSSARSRLYALAPRSRKIGFGKTTDCFSVLLFWG